MALQRVSQEVTELILAHLPDEAGTIAESSQANCDVGRGTTRRFFECGSLSQAHSRLRRDKVNEQLAAGDDIHCSHLQWRVPPFLGEECSSSLFRVVTTSRTPIILMFTASCKNAQRGVPSLMAGLAVGQYLRLDALALANHIQCRGKVLQRKRRGQQGFCVKHTTADKINSRTIGEQDGHRAKHSDFVIVDAERGERNPG